MDGRRYFQPTQFRELAISGCDVLHIPEASQTALVNNLLAFCIGAIAGLTFFHARDQRAALHGFGIS